MRNGGVGGLCEGGAEESGRAEERWSEANCHN
jgi:hypothetical protein